MIARRIDPIDTGLWKKKQTFTARRVEGVKI
jgi:hypothetical protein